MPPLLVLLQIVDLLISFKTHRVMKRKFGTLETFLLELHRSTLSDHFSDAEVNLCFLLFSITRTSKSSSFRQVDGPAALANFKGFQVSRGS